MEQINSSVEIASSFTGTEIFSIVIAAVLLLCVFVGGDVLEHYQTKKYRGN